MSKLDLIMMVRGLYDLGLKEAKDLVDKATGIFFVACGDTPWVGTADGQTLLEPEERHRFLEMVRRSYKDKSITVLPDDAE